MLHRSGPVDCVVQQCAYRTKICDIYDLQKCLTQTSVDFEQNVIEAAVDQLRDSLRSCMRAGGGHVEHMLRNYLWSPYGIGRPYIFSCCNLFFFIMVALCNRADHYIFAL